MHRVTFGVLILMLLAGSAAQADDRETEMARQHLHKAKQAYELGRWDEAITEYEKAYTFRNDPILLFNMAQAYRRRGDLQRAIDLYKNYLIRDPGTHQRADVEERIRALQKQLEKGGTSTSLATTPPASVPPASPTPPPASPTPPPAVDATPPGQSLVAPPSPVAGPVAPATVAPPAPALVPPPTPPAAPEPLPQPAAPRRSRPLTIAGMALGGAGVVALGVGAFMGWRASSLSSEVSSAAKQGTFDNGKYESGQTAETWQWIGYGTGVAALAAGGVLYLLGGRTERAAAVSMVVVPSIGTCGAGAQLAFGF